MRLLKQSGNQFQYELRPEEAQALRLLVGQFPITPFSPVKISKSEAKAGEREKLINESLAAQRDELKQKAKDLIHDGKFKISGNYQLFRINPEEREMLLQILNDIRVESWRILGEPENLDRNIFDLPKEKIKHYHSMHVAGFFEHHFLNVDNEEKG